MTERTITPRLPEGNSGRDFGILINPFAGGQGGDGVMKGALEILNSGLQQTGEACGCKTSVELVDMGTTKSQLSDNRTDVDEKYRLRDVISCGELLGRAFHRFESILSVSDIAMQVGGDHSVAVASVAASKLRYPDLRVIWVDAHGDLNVPAQSNSGNYHGMVLGHLLGHFPDSHKDMPGWEWMRPYLDGRHLCNDEIAYIALRDLDEYEKLTIRRLDIEAKCMEHVERRGIYGTVIEILNRLDPERSHPWHVSFDVDACDPKVAPGTGTKAEGGLTYREALGVFQCLRSEQVRIVSFDIVEVDADQDETVEPLHGDDYWVSTKKRTVKLAHSLVKAALGAENHLDPVPRKPSLRGENDPEETCVN